MRAAAPGTRQLLTMFPECLLAAVHAAPALAAGFYIVQDGATKKCTVVDMRRQ